MFSRIKKWFSRKVESVPVEEVITEVNYLYPTEPLPAVRITEPRRKKPKVTAEDIRAWLRAVKEYDTVRAMWN